MILRKRTRDRSGAVVVESAIVMPVALLVIFGIVAGTLAIFTYQQVASLARQGARYASVRGHYYSQSTGNAAATPEDVYNNGVVPKFVNIDPSQMTYSVTWNPDNKQGSYVTVVLTYKLSIPVYGTMTLTSTSCQQITW